MLKKLPHTFLDHDIYVGMEITKKEFKKFFKESYEDFLDDCEGIAQVHHLSCGELIVFHECEEMNVGIIAHECYHAAYRVWQKIGAVHDDYGDEAFAYFLEFVVNECATFYANNKRFLYFDKINGVIAVEEQN